MITKQLNEVKTRTHMTEGKQLEIKIT